MTLVFVSVMFPDPAPPRIVVLVVSEVVIKEEGRIFISDLLFKEHNYLHKELVILIRKPEPASVPSDMNLIHILFPDDIFGCGIADPHILPMLFE